MYIQIRTIDATRKVTLDVSKTSLVSELKNLLHPHFKIAPEKQRLFFRGKQLEDEYSLFDYNVNLNDMIQIMEKVVIEPPKETSEPKSKVKESSSTSQIGENEEKSVGSSLYFKVGEFVDVYDTTYGAWCEGRICRILKDPNPTETREQFKADEETSWPHDGFFYDVDLLEEGETTSTISKARIKSILPRAREKIPFQDVKVGDTILANYNIEEPKTRGFWYLAKVKGTKTNKNSNVVVADILITDETPLLNCHVIFTDELMKVEERKLLEDRTPSDLEPTARTTGEPDQRCDQCKNNNKRKCKECGCHVCGLKTDENKQIMCDECDYAFHIWCLKPPLQEIPEVDEWYCPECKNDENEIVSAGSKLKESKKKARMASKQNASTSRDWGKGMACIGRTKQCTIVPQDHFGPIPGVEVGTLWKFRIQASEAGVHRPHVAGIHGRENLGAFSVVLSGGYEDDVDNGDEFLYTGSGGRDLSGNKRTNDQSFDQKLERFNKAIAMNCNVPLNQKGAEAKDWKGGKPVRVIRNYKLAKHSKYAPEDGNRYDGIYKVVKYFPVKGKSGFTVWRFLFRRDDPTPAPWTKEGNKRIESLGLEMQYPEGYLEAKEAKDQEKDQETPKPKGKGKKRVLEESPNPQPQAVSASKKVKVACYTLGDDENLAIAKDTDNDKLWDECKSEASQGKKKFLSKVEEIFTCICCTEVVFNPITTGCKHNFCTDCLKRAFDADVMSCPTCRAPLERELLKKVNSSLQAALDLLFPGYSAAR